MAYFLIYNSDGDTFVSKVTKKEIIRLAKEDSWSFCDHDEFHSDTNYWSWGNHSCVIIKGEVVSPVEKKTIVEYDID